jgi:hypothetical protein
MSNFLVSRSDRKVATNAAILILFFAPPRRVRCEKFFLNSEQKVQECDATEI